MNNILWNIKGLSVVRAYLLVCFIVVSVGDVCAMDVRTALDEYEKYLLSINSIEFHYVVPGEWRNEGHLKRDGEKMWVLSQDASGQQMEFVTYADGIGVSCYGSPDDPGNVRVVSVLSPMRGKRYNPCQISRCSFLFGFIAIAHATNCDNLVALLRSGGTLLSEENSDGIETVKLQKNIGDVQVSVWLVPSKNFAHSRLLVESSNMRPDEPGRTVLTDIRITDFVAVNDTFMPQNCHMMVKNVGLTYAEENGKPVEKKFISDGQMKMVCSDFKIRKFAGNEFRITTKILNGIPVYMEDALHIEHIWMDGKIEPKTDAVMLAIAQGDHKFIPGTDESRFWFMALGAILIIVGFTLKGIELYKKWNSDDNEKGGGS